MDPNETKPAEGNALTKPLPRPVVIGFVALLVLGVLFVPAMRLLNKMTEPGPAPRQPMPPRTGSAATPPPVTKISNRQWVDEGVAEQLPEALASDPELFTRADDDGWVFVHYAAAACRADLLAAAATLGADLDAMTELGFTPLHMVMARALIGLGVTDDDVGSSLYALLDGGADANTHLPDSPAGSPAAWADGHGFSRVLGVFREYGFEPQAAHAAVYPTSVIRIGDDLDRIKQVRLDLGLGWASDDTGARDLIAQYRETQAVERVRNWGYGTRLNGRVWFLLDADGLVQEVLYWPTIEAYMAGDPPDRVESITLESGEHNTPAWSNKVGL